MRLKKIITIFLIVLTAASVIWLIKTKSKNYCQNKEVVIYSLQNKKYCLLVADSQNEWTKGLMNVKKPVNFDGMIFIFPKKERLTFWNQNTLLDLDIYWLADRQVVGKSFLPSIEKSKRIVTVDSVKEVDWVIEIIK